MGEAARRKAEIAALKGRQEAWLAALPNDEALIAKISLVAYEKIVIGLGMTEGCYNLAFFLHEYLRKKHGIQVDVVIGWANDGDWEGAMSHAWIEYHGKKIDISLHKTTRPDIQIPGNLIILDYAYLKGRVSYTYWKELPLKAAEAMDEMSRQSAEFARVHAYKKAEHEQMLRFSSSVEGIESYFQNAPPQNRFETLAKLVENGMR